MPLRARNKTNDTAYLVQYHEDEIFQVRPSGMIVTGNEILVGSAYPVQWGQSNEIAVAKIIAAGTETAMRILKTTKEKEAISSSTQLGGSKRPCTSTPKTRTSSSQPSSPKKPRSSTPKAQTQSTKQNNKIQMCSHTTEFIKHNTAQAC